MPENSKSIRDLTDEDWRRLYAELDSLTPEDVARLLRQRQEAYDASWAAYERTVAGQSDDGV